jgi:lipopolysaccharide transport system ATP-binding protein
MSEIAIHGEGLGKQYRIGRSVPQGDLRETLANALATPWRRLRGERARAAPSSASADDLIWALQDASFDVSSGHAVGLIGNNGSGKSTLLKILSRIVEPTTGFADIQGRVGSLLEVGSGFHVELTGRENIFLSGAVLGMRRREIERKLEEIVAFAGVHRFLDTPVKHYSSGMYMRLAFAVAAHLETEILLVDEVLAVGDANFQKKCLAKMEDVTQHGRTIILVSHNMAAVQSLCQEAIWLQDGRVAARGAAGDVVQHYLGTQGIVTEQVWDSPERAPGNGHVRVHRVAIRPEGGLPGETLTIDAPMLFEVEFWNLLDCAPLVAGFHLYRDTGNLVFTSRPLNNVIWRGPSQAGLFRSTCRIPANLLNTGMHVVRLLFMEYPSTVIFALNDPVRFEVREPPRADGWSGEWAGVVRPNLEWATELLEPAAELVGARR